MEIKFQTKEESNRKEEEAFLKLAKSERVWRFFELMQKAKAFPQNQNHLIPITFLLIFISF